MRGVYNWMGIGLALTGMVAMLIASDEQTVRLITGNKILFYGLLIGELLMVLGLVGLVGRMSALAATALFVAYSALNGVTLSVIFYAYTAESLAATFFITAGTFGAMSAFGYLTKRDLSGMGQFLMMGLFGIIIASIVNIFVASTTLMWVTTYVGVLVFTGLTAYDTQKIKRLGMHTTEGTENTKKATIIGALSLYLDFINLFLMMLRIFGGRR
ncbi:MAG: Bax inhibitor-1/YccA family protein [Myxococcota bacterium]